MNRTKHAFLIAMMVGAGAGCATAQPCVPAEAVVSSCPEAPTPADPAAASELAGFAQNVAGVTARVAPSGKAEALALATGNNAYVGILRIDAGAAVPEHADPTEEYIYVLSGEGRVVIDGAAFRVGPQTLIFMPAGARVSFQNGDAPLEALQIFAGPQPATKYEAWKPAE